MFQEINPKACECLRCYFQGNDRLDDEHPSQAITLYNQALYAYNRHPKNSAQLPKGKILVGINRVLSCAVWILTVGTNSTEFLLFIL